LNCSPIVDGSKHGPLRPSILYLTAVLRDQPVCVC
jgi:hypothetical protein